MKKDVTTLNVELGERSYPIYIGGDILGDIDFYRSHITGSEVCIVTNETVAPLYLSKVEKALPDYRVISVVLSDGEEFKTLAEWQKIIDSLIRNRFSRKCTVIALGGGVVGDMAGFAAAAYQRGVNFIQVPTTLLSQVDSSVGGKTGVNHPLGKNMIGAFYQPKCVVADTTSLQTLETRQFCSGLAEIIKYGLIIDADFFSWLENNMAALMEQDSAALAYAIERSCQIKAEVVAADELESGKRALLNLGHTFGHAIETGMGYGDWLHGEAVAAGACLAADLSCRMGWINGEQRERAIRIHQQAELPIYPPKSLDSTKLMELMAVDKKVIDGKLRLVLLEGIGNAVVTEAFDMDLLRETLNEYGRS